MVRLAKLSSNWPEVKIELLIILNLLSSYLQLLPFSVLQQPTEKGNLCGKVVRFRRIKAAFTLVRFLKAALKFELENVYPVYF